VKQGVDVLHHLDHKTAEQSIDNRIQTINKDGCRVINVSITSDGMQNYSYTATILWEKIEPKTE